jgi:predicted ABC-type ATPase
VALTAGRVALEKRSQCLAKGIDFAVETTLAGAGVLALMKQAQARGFEIRLIYVALKNADLSIQRVRERAALGGHFVPPDDVRRRYDRSLANAPAAILIADSSVVFDNSRLGHRKILEAQRGVVLWTAPRLPDWVRRVLSDLESLNAQQEGAT